MPTQLIAKLIELAHNEFQSDLEEHEIENRLVSNLLDRELDFTTEKGEQGTISFHSIGRGKNRPSTVVTLQAKGIEFEQDEQRLSLDLRYVFYEEYGHDFLINNNLTKFLITSPFVQKLGPSNYLIDFVMYGETIYRVNRCLSVFAGVIQAHQSSIHQTAIDWYDNRKSDWDDDPEISLEKPIRGGDPTEEPLEYLYGRSRDETYIGKYIKYIDNADGEMRELIDNRNTYAESEI